MEQTLLQTALQQAPGAALVVVITLAFLRYLTHRDKEQSVMFERCISSIDRNTEMYGAVRQALEDVTNALRRINTGSK